MQLTRIRRSRHEAHATEALCRGFEDFTFFGTVSELLWSSLPSVNVVVACDSVCWSLVLGMSTGMASEAMIFVQKMTPSDISNLI